MPIAFALLGVALVLYLAVMLWAGAMNMKPETLVLMTYWYLPVGAIFCFVIAGWLLFT